METVAYVEGKGGPGQLQNYIEEIQKSGLTTAILGMIHVGRIMSGYPKMKVGDLIYNDYPDPAKGVRGNLLVSEGKFNPNGDPEIAAWPGQVARLKQTGGVRKVLLSIGGAGDVIYDFRTIHAMYQLGMEGMLAQNIAALKAACTIGGVCAIDGFDLDCEEGPFGGGGPYDPVCDPYASPGTDTLVQFCKLLFQHGFEVTFCPYTAPDWWGTSMARLENDWKKVSWWNLQCYSGGIGNLIDLKSWIDALNTVVGGNGESYLVPGLAVAGVSDVSRKEWHCPNQMKNTINGWALPNLRGVFLWKYDGIGAVAGVCQPPNSPLDPTLAAYVGHINNQ